ncbi:MAG: hypothetical protein LBT59_17045 [Clostridiales bacterium]|jgi:hypothetical protein|nr:hypothetical protein [Clostridiales bacterium]
MTKEVPADPFMMAGMMDCLSIAIENAVLEWGDTLEGFLDKFIRSGLEKAFSDQAPFVTTGCTGEELVVKVYERLTGQPLDIRVNPDMLQYSEYFWIGYAIALLVAEKGFTVREMLECIPPQEWLRLYHLGREYGDELLLEKLSKYMRTSKSI